MKDMYGAITGPAGAVWPYRLVTGAFDNLMKKYPDRISIETNSPVLSIAVKESESEYPYTSKIPRGSINSKHIIHATNGHASHLLPRMRGKIVPLRGQMSVQRRSGAANVGSTRSWLFKNAKEFNYMTQNPASGDYFLGGGTLQSGDGGLEPLGSTADDQQDLLALGYLQTVLGKSLAPEDVRNGESSGKVGDPSLVSSWTGVMGFSCDDRPWVGKLSPEISDRRPKCTAGAECGEWIAAGFCGMGMVNCWRAGQAVALTMMGKDVDWFPESLLPTMERFQTASTEEMATHWVSVST